MLLLPQSLKRQIIFAGSLLMMVMVVMGSMNCMVGDRYLKLVAPPTLQPALSI